MKIHNRVGNKYYNERFKQLNEMMYFSLLQYVIKSMATALHPQ